MSSKSSHIHEARLAALRAQMVAAGVSSYLVGSEDAHQSEYVSEHDKRRQWLSGFTGSAGTALVTQTKALLWTDGRYFLQAEQELGSSWTLMRMGEPKVPTLEEWVARGGVEDHCVGVDPWLMGAGTARRIGDKIKSVGGAVIPVQGNLVDKIWVDQPPKPANPVKIHPLEYAGVPISEKLTAIRRHTTEAGASSLVVMALDEVAWLFNIRGGDVPFNPVTTASALVTQEAAILFIDEAKLGAGTKEHLGDQVTVRPYTDLIKELGALETVAPPPPPMKPTPAAKDGKPANVSKVLVDPKVCLAVRDAVPPGLVLEAPSPIALAKALKNQKELEVR
ncbi:unnamed protein product [Discosporangium mesarthrocarpum]